MSCTLRAVNHNGVTKPHPKSQGIPQRLLIQRFGGCQEPRFSVLLRAVSSGPILGEARAWMPAPPVTSVNLAFSWKHTDKSLKTALSQLTGIYKLHIDADSSRKPPLFSTLGCVPCDCNEMVQAAWGTGKHGLGSTALEPDPLRL